LEFKDEELGIVANQYIEDMTRNHGDYKKFSILGEKLKFKQEISYIVFNFTNN